MLPCGRSLPSIAKVMLLLERPVLPLANDLKPLGDSNFGLIIWPK